MDCSCTKKKFSTAEEASKRCGEINSENKNNKMRSYKCPNCDKYLLTSMSKNEYKYKTDNAYRNKVRQDQFIKMESQYWEQKFGVE